MSGWAIPQERIARVIGCDAKTLRKHFGPELDVGSARLEAQLAQNLLRIAQGPDRAALVATIFALKSRFGWVEALPPQREREGVALRRRRPRDARVHVPRARQWRAEHGQLHAARDASADAGALACGARGVGC